MRVCIISFKQSGEAYENKAEDKGCCKHFSLSVKSDQLGQSENELIEVWWTQKLFGANGSTWILRYAFISSIYLAELVSNSYELRIFDACKQACYLRLFVQVCEVGPSDVCPPSFANFLPRSPFPCLLASSFLPTPKPLLPPTKDAPAPYVSLTIACWPPQR